MNLQSIIQIFQTPLLAKLFILLIGLFLVLYLRKKDTEGLMSGFFGLIIVLLFRDFVYAFYPLEQIFIVSDYVFFGLYLFIVFTSYDSAAFMWIAIIFNAGAAAGITALTAMGIASKIPMFLFQIPLAVNIILFVVYSVIRRSRDETVPQALFSRIWPLATIWLTLYVTVSIIFGIQNVYVQSAAVPMLYALIILAAVKFIDVIDTQIVAANDYYEQAIDSLYNLFMGTGTAIKSSFKMEDVLDAMNQNVVIETGADSGIVFLVDEFDDVISVRSMQGTFPPVFKLPENVPLKQNRVETYMRHAEFKLGETLFGEVAQTGKHVFVPDAYSDERIIKNGDEEWCIPASLIIVPLLVEDRVIGIIGVAKMTKGSRFTEKDYDRCKLLSNFGSLAINNFYSFVEASERGDIEREASIASDIQKTIIPKKLPEFDTVALGAYTSPAKGVCSDYFDVIQTRKDRFYVVVGDVAGKGVSAAIVMVMIRSILHLITNSDKDMATVMNWVNRGITGKVDMDHYATLNAISYDVSSSTIEYSSASAQPAIVYRVANDTIESIEIKSLPIGVERQTNYQSKTFKIAKGDVVVLYTDGIVETMNSLGQQYGRKNLGAVIQRNHSLTAKEIATKIKGDIQEFSGKTRQHDDQTVLVLKMKP